MHVRDVDISKNILANTKQEITDWIALEKKERTKNTLKYKLPFYYKCILDYQLILNMFELIKFILFNRFAHSAGPGLAE